MEHFTPKEIRQQADNQTCLPVSLLMYYSWCYPEVDLNFENLEEELHRESFGVHPEYYVLSYATVFVRKFPNVTLNLMIDSPVFANSVSQHTDESRITVTQQGIRVPWIREQTQKVPLLLYVDAFYIGYPVHMEHFLYVFQNTSGQLCTIDSALGEVATITDETLDHAIGGLKYHLLWSPVAITLTKSSD